jgi:hypothetical protein
MKTGSGQGELTGKAKYRRFNFLSALLISNSGKFD